MRHGKLQIKTTPLCIMLQRKVYSILLQTLLNLLNNCILKYVLVHNTE